uniref:Uncharacterized protein n=2 Tax=Araneus ventricosus TaxID=182803 RepID=A0A4Y2G553_ARAVE|nr:hypothetical protein AVEN_57030-1 [Araneus ventricosus]
MSKLMECILRCRSLYSKGDGLDGGGDHAHGPGQRVPAPRDGHQRDVYARIPAEYRQPDGQVRPGQVEAQGARVPDLYVRSVWYSSFRLFFGTFLV